MRKKALELPEEGVPPEVMRLVPLDNSLEKIQMQKAATPVPRPDGLQEAADILNSTKANAVVCEKGSFDEGDINAQRIEAVRSFVQRLDETCVHDGVDDASNSSEEGQNSTSAGLMITPKRPTSPPDGFKSHQDAPEGLEDAPDEISKRPKEPHALSTEPVVKRSRRSKRPKEPHALSSEPVVKRSRRSVKSPGEKKLEDKVLRETPMQKLTHQQNERLVRVQGKLQEASLLLHALICESSKHKGTKVPSNMLDKAKAVAAELVKLVTMASDMHATDKTPEGMIPVFWKDAKHATHVAKDVSAKMSSLIVD